ncbi:hypothetical protein A1353_05450 [Methylomonas methanica]|uniref:Uncharacterized protein n=1 Tax=Methylomonas methanica TaxID=421 RepID=A0A177MTU7_METMH|nr:hypothetical protein [Methylomonas methanica]OAI09012.1 hypothetical protein A1353_05450 [Methylomonas methanica]
MPTPSKELVALHKHWCIADSIKQVVLAPLPEISRQTTTKRLPDDLAAFAESHSRFMRLQIWYALLYVVIEGYRALDHKSVEVEKLLSNEEMVNALRLFRNAVFHYQKDPLTEKLLVFLDAKESEIWIWHLNSALKKHLEFLLPIESWFNTVAVPVYRRPWWRFWGSGNE